MINISKFNPNLSIKHSILLLILLPSFLITTILTSYLIVSRQSDAQNELLIQASSALNYISSSSELPLYSADISALQRLGIAVILNDEIKSVTYFDSNKKIISTSGSFSDEPKMYPTDSFYSKEKNSEWIFQTPILNSEIEVDDYKDDSQEPVSNDTQTKNLGWIQLVVDKKPLIDKQKNILLTSFGLGSVLFSLLAFFAFILSRSLTVPLHSITETIRELEKGDLDARIRVKANGEIKELVDGINQLSDKVKVSNRRLNVKIQEATQQLTSTLSELEVRNKDLELTGNELINANNAKDDFLASVSHELRTPLTSIIGYADLLEKTKLNSQQKNHVSTISQASEILLHLIDNILDLSKLESESLELELIPFNIDELLSEVYSLHMPAAKEKGIKLKLSTEIDLIKNLVSDPLRIKQVLNNLIHNAIKFTDKGFVDVNVSRLENGFGLLVKIKDSGIGIERKNLKELFKPFHQADSSISRKFGGTGLGLVICEKLVKQLGGEIKIQSELGFGSEAIFTIKNITANSNTSEFEHVVSQVNTEYIETLFTEKKILIAEDNKFVRDLLINIFKQTDARVTVTEDGSQALKEIDEEKPDLVILDYQMPLLNGVETTQEIRKKYSKKELPIFLITADVINTNKDEIKKVGINKIIYKPIKADKLIDQIQKVFYTKKDKVKVLDLISDELLQDEIKRLQTSIVKTFESKDYKRLNKDIHDLCGIAGPASQYKEIWEVAKTLDAKVKNKEFDDLQNEIIKLTKIAV